MRSLMSQPEIELESSHFFFTDIRTCDSGSRLAGCIVSVTLHVRTKREAAV